MGYNQISMHPLNEEKMAFITPIANYCYKLMQFRLKNTGASYQRLMNKIFADYIGTLMKVYIDNMLVKTSKDKRLISDLKIIFGCLHKYKMRLNHWKCAFTIEAEKFPRFILTYCKIEASPNKCRAILEIQSPASVKEVHYLIGKIASLSRLIAALA